MIPMAYSHLYRCRTVHREAVRAASCSLVTSPQGRRMLNFSPSNYELAWHPMMMDEAADLEAKYVHDVYSQIARHFSDTRYKPWPRIAQFLLTLPPGCLVADVGMC